MALFVSMLLTAATASQDTIHIKTEYHQDTISIGTPHTQDSIALKTEDRQDTINIQAEHSQDSISIQTCHPQDSIETSIVHKHTPPTKKQNKRKKVALVLSGGGAKGMAHIGVLKVLERAGIPIDYITGTSMGSIVGGLYAIGYNSQLLDSIVRKQDWTYIITDKEDMSKQSLTDREKEYTYILSTGITSSKNDVKSGGIIKGKNVEALLSRLCTGYTDSLNFSKDFHIPFACVSTNIMDNSEVVFHSGRLPQAMRASMAIPAAFSPVRMGDKILVDGCLRNNYPADVAREMGADIIIGVTLDGKPKKAKDITSTMSVLGQILDINFSNKYKENIAITDLHMNVDPHSYSTASFNSEAVDSLIHFGEEEAMRHWDEIMALKERIGVSKDYHPELLSPLRPEVLTERRYVKEFAFENLTPNAIKFLKQKFHLDRTDSIDAKLEQELVSSIRIDLFYNTAECLLVPDGAGVRVVLSAGDRKSMQFYAGIRFDTEEYVALKLDLEIPLKTAMPINTDIMVRLGKRIMAGAAITAHPTSFTRPTLGFNFYHNDMDIYMDGNRDYTFQYNQWQAELTPLNFDWRHFNVRLGVRWDYMHYRNQLATGAMKDIEMKDEHFYSYRFQMTYNNEDDWNFPTRGTRFKAAYVYYTDNFVKLNDEIGMREINGNLRSSFTLGDRFTLQPMIYGRLLFGNVKPPIFGNVIGGNWFGHYLEQQMPFAGLGNTEYVDNHFVAAQLQGQQRLGKNNFILLRLAAAQQAGKFNKIFDDSPLLGAQLAYFYKNMFGPAGATLGYSNHTKSVYFYVNLGYVF